jgi:hypothetical protein
MVNEKLFALDGYARGLQKSPRTREALAEIEGDLATEELYTHDVATRVTVTDREIADGVRNERVAISLDWIFTPTDSGVARYQRMLRGSSFDSAYARQLREGATAGDRSLRTTKFDLSMNNPVLSGIVDSLAVGAISLPIHVEDGWYIVRLTDVQTSPIITQTEEVRLREDVHRALVQQKSDRLSDGYVKQMMLDSKPTIERRAFDILQTYLAKTLLPPDSFAHWELANLLARKWGPVEFTDIGPFRSETLVTHARGTFLVSDFLLWYGARSANLHLSIASPKAFFTSLEEYTWRMVRDRLLTQRACAQRFQFRDAVRKQKKWWEEKFLYDLEKNMIGDSIAMDSSKLLEYYAHHEREFRDASGTPQPYRSVTEDVSRAYYSSALTERMLHRLIALKGRYKVSINEAALESLAVDIQNQPNGIDVYAVKKGGTFPRQAFPTIDHGWQAWN